MAPGVDYRQLQAPAQVDTSLPDSGAAARAAALGQAFKEFEGVSGDIANKASTQAGALAGAAAGATGHPQYKQGLLRFTAYSRAFNNAATGAYAVQAAAAADDAAARLRVEANKNPDTFVTTYSAVRDAVVKAAPPLAQPMLLQLYNQHLAAGRAALSGDQALELQTRHRQEYDAGIQRQTSRVAYLQGSENPQDQFQALDEHTILTTMINGGVNAGLYSPAEAQAMHIGAARAITSQVFTTTVDKELAKPAEQRDVVGLMERFRQAHLANIGNSEEPPVLAEAEYQKLFADAFTRVREQNMFEAMNKREGKSAEQIKWEAGDVALTSQLLAGKLTDAQLNDAVRTGDIKPERATSLHMMLLQGPQAIKSDPRALLKLHTDPHFLDMTLDELAHTPGISPQDQLKVYEEQQKRINGWEGTQQSKQAVGTISAALKILPGTPTASMSEAQRKAFTDAHQEYIGLVNALKPSEQQNPAALSTAAQTAIKHTQQREAAANVDTFTIARQRFVTQHGPGSPEPADDKVYQDRLKHYDDLIQQNRSAAKAQ